MREIFINDYNLKPEELNYEVVRVKAILINRDNNIVLIHNNNTYQFPGGHQEKDESREDAIKREIMEEVGIKEITVEQPFLLIKTYAKNYFNSGKNVCNKIYYYLIYTDECASINEEYFDELEKQSNFSIIYVLASRFREFLEYHLKNNSIEESIAREMILVDEQLEEVLNRNA